MPFGSGDHGNDRESVEAAASASVLLQGMSGGLRAGFLERLKVESLGSGQTLMAAGERGEALYLIVSGRVRVLDAGGEKIAELGKGDTVGETSLMTGEQRTATVVALRDSLVARLDRDGFGEFDCGVSAGDDGSVYAADGGAVARGVEGEEEP